MITRTEVIGKAVDDCLKELYQYVYPKVKWDDFIEENKIYSEKYKVWERYRHLSNKENKSKKELEEYEMFSKKWDGKSITECIGPRPYEFYYLPEKILKHICDSYVHSYRMDSRQEFLDNISILKEYCENPIIDKYIDEKGKPGDKDWKPGYRSYEHPDNLKKEIIKIIEEYDDSDTMKESDDIVNKFFEFLDMAGNFYNWTRDVNTFNVSVYLGPSPNSNKGSVIENWKKYRNQNIEIIDDEQIIKEYYGEEY